MATTGHAQSASPPALTIRRSFESLPPRHDTDGNFTWAGSSSCHIPPPSTRLCSASRFHPTQYLARADRHLRRHHQFSPQQSPARGIGELMWNGVLSLAISGCGSERSLRTEPERTVFSRRPIGLQSAGLDFAVVPRPEGPRTARTKTSSDGDSSDSGQINEGQCSRLDRKPSLKTGPCSRGVPKRGARRSPTSIVPREIPKQRTFANVQCLSSQFHNSLARNAKGI